jgi:hypothetical protein
MRRLFVLALALYGSVLRADSPALTISQQLIPSPASIGASAPAFTSGPHGLTLTWLEPDTNNQLHRLAATWETTHARWSPPHPFAPSADGSFENAASPRVRFHDGSALSVFLPEKDGRILDLHTQRHRGHIASEPRALSPESWAKGNTPAEPPVLAAREARVIAVWLNHAENSPRLLAALTTSAGESFFLPVRIDDGQPLGRASLALLRDGSAYISWLETYGPGKTSAALWLRRLSPAGDLSVPVLIATAASADAFGHPQLALGKDYDETAAQLLIAYPLTHDGISQLITRLITLPPAESFAQGRPCLTCPPDNATKSGHALMGRVVKLVPRNNQVLIDHSEVPGILPAGSTTFRIDDQTLHSLRDVTTLLARIEQRDGVWWLFDVSVLVTNNRH